MKRFNVTSSNIAKLVTVFLMIGLVGSLAFVYANHDPEKGTVDNQKVGQTTNSQAQGVESGNAEAGDKAKLLTPPPQPAAASANTWPASPAAPSGMAVNAIGVVASSNSPKAGDNITVTLYENSGSADVNSVQVRLTYDATKLTFVKTVASTDFGLEAATDTSTPGVIQLARAGSGESISGTRAVSVLHFTVASSAIGDATIQPDLAKSFLVRTSDSANILQSVSPAQLTIQNR